MASSLGTEDSCEPPSTGPGTAYDEKHTVARSGRRKRPTVPLDQRKRAKKACEPCRRDKLRCDGRSPCSRCPGNQRQCLYASSKISPDMSSESDRINSVQQAQQHSAEKLRLLESIFAKLHPDVRTDDLNALRNYGPTSPAHPECVTPEETRHQPLYLSTSSQPDVGDGLVDLGRHDALGRTPMPTATITVINQGKTHFEGRFSSWTFFKSARQLVTEGQAHTESGGNDGTETMEAGESEECHENSLLHQWPAIQCSPDLKTAVLAALPPRDVVDFLVATFFRSAQANQFYIHPEIFSRKLTALYDGTNEFDLLKASDSKRSSEFICLMFMVFAIGSQFAEVAIPNADAGRRDTEDQLPPFASASPGMPALDFSRLNVPKPSQSPGWHFYEISRKLLPDVIVSSSMTSVQVCVLQGIFLPSAKSRDAGYNLLGLALRMAVNMGMHRSFGTESLHPHVRELRNRLWWSVYVAERMFSVEMGRPLAINDAEIDAPLPVDIPEWGHLTGRSPTNDGLIAMIKLCHLLGKIVNIVYCTPASGEGTIMSPRAFRQLQDEVEQSRKNLPPRLRTSPEDTISRSVAHVSLAYEQATILLTRSCLNYAAAANHSWILNDAISGFVRQQAQTCVKSAVATIRIMFSLRARSQLCRFSFHDSLYCTAAVYVILIAKNLNWFSLDIIKESIRQGVLVLLDLAEGSQLAAGALTHILRSLQNDISNSEDGSEVVATSEEARLEKGRKAWKAWVAQSPHGILAKFTVNSIRSSEDMPSVNNEDATNPPTLVDERSHASGMFDLPSFWVLENPDFNIFSRDLTAAPDMPILGNCNLL